MKISDRADESFIHSLLKYSCMRTDADIQKDVIAQLQCEPFLNAAGIGVAVKNGVVALSGEVACYARKQAAEKVARKITGVRALTEEIYVSGSGGGRVTDTEIADTVATALTWHTAMQEHKINIKVENGVVTLEGQVDFDYQRRAAFEAIENLAGIRRINHFLTIRQAPAPEEVEKKIRGAIARNANIEEGLIRIDITGHKAILSGSVFTLNEKDEVEQAALSAPGITTVENNLEVIEKAFL